MMQVATWCLAALAVACVMPVWAHAETCELHLHGNIIYDRTDSQGNPRHNPDHTLYPNDAFSFSFPYRFGDHCISPSIGMIQQDMAVHKEHVLGPEGASVQPGSSGTVSGGAAILVGPANRCHGAVPEGGGGLDGYDTAFGESRLCGHLSLTITAYSRICDQTGCRLQRVQDTATVTPDVVAPIVHTNMIRHMLTDPQGYPAINLDDTYYVWDPAGLEHGAVFEHKDERAGAIRFEYQRVHEHLSEEGGIQCDSLCASDMVTHPRYRGSGFLPYPGDYGNGDGMYAYAATGPDGIGERTIRYAVTVLNSDIPINSGRNHTEISVVAYEPVFAHYPYTVLDDGAPRAYGDRQGVAMRYEGSADTDSDGNPIIHPDRRAKITNFDQSTTARSASPLVPELALPDDMLLWNSSWAPPHAGRYDAAKTTLAETVRGTESLPSHPFQDNSENGCPETVPSRNFNPRCHAMFLYASHAAMRFQQDITDIILEQYRYRWYDNVTTSNVIASDDWAGHVHNPVFNYTYTYPHTELSSTFGLHAHGDHHSISVPVQISAVPHNITHKHDSYLSIPHGPSVPITITVHDYIRAKTVHDTGDHTMADIIINDTYDTVQESSGDGSALLHLNKTSLRFWSGPLLLAGYDTITDISMYEALEYEGPLTLSIKVQNRTHNVTAPFQYDVSYVEHLQTGSTIPLDISRTGSQTAQVAVPSTFGMAKDVSVRGAHHTLHNMCHSMPCTIPVSSGSADITIRNVWGGSAMGTIPAHNDIIQHPDTDYKMEQMTSVIMSLMPLVALLATIRVLWHRIMPYM